MNEPLDTPIDIRDVAKRTGLTSRALRFYEARGLLKPLRTYGGSTAAASSSASSRFWR
jgi:hypothetical protein